MVPTARWSAPAPLLPASVAAASSHLLPPSLWLILDLQDKPNLVLPDDALQAGERFRDVVINRRARAIWSECRGPLTTPGSPAARGGDRVLNRARCPHDPGSPWR